MPLKLIIANKAYSSWSLRPWILLAHLKIPFEEIIIPMDEPDSRKKMLKYAPTGKCPSLQDGDIQVWDSLSIIEYIAEKYPNKLVWPSTRAARAHARSLACEMHSGFVALRQYLPMNVRRPVGIRELMPEVAADVERLERAFAQARKMFGKGGPFLFGRFCAADAMFAPVVSRFHTYDVGVSSSTRAYMAAVLALPAWKAWIKDATAEPWRIERYEREEV